MNPKVLQYLMGHSDISVTLNTYSHVQYEDAKAEVAKMTGKEAAESAATKFRPNDLLNAGP